METVRGPSAICIAAGHPATHDHQGVISLRISSAYASIKAYDSAEG
jgi:hypothetical protein